MRQRHNSTGFAIALAWPQTYCKQAGTWYDPITSLLGVSNNHYYKVGHAALILIEMESLKSYYFDFGRYHSPYQHGRVRSAETDHELSLKTVPQLNENNTRINNFLSIISEIQMNSASHGEGNLHASYCLIDFKKTLETIKLMQRSGSIPYGPFVLNGSNCSRFVNTAILAGNPNFRIKFKLRFGIPLTPTPLTNVNALNNRIMIPKLTGIKLFYPAKKLEKSILLTTLEKPERKPNIPENAQWLSGEGAGSWFVLEKAHSHVKVTRYSPQGVIECSGIYRSKEFNLIESLKKLTITYPSNCNTITLMNGNTKIRFNKIR